jgi:hypothetical protein
MRAPRNGDPLTLALAPASPKLDTTFTLVLYIKLWYHSFLDSFIPTGPFLAENYAQLALGKDACTT